MLDYDPASKLRDDPQGLIFVGAAIHTPNATGDGRHDPPSTSLVGHRRQATATQNRRFSLDELRQAEDLAPAVSPAAPAYFTAAAAPWNPSAPSNVIHGPWQVWHRGDAISARISQFALGTVRQITPRHCAAQSDDLDADRELGYGIREVRDLVTVAPSTWSPLQWETDASQPPQGIDEISAMARALRSARSAIRAGTALTLAGSAALVLGQMIGH